MVFIRTFWGDLSKYIHQMDDAKLDNLNEKVIVWGKENEKILTEKGFDCHLVHDGPYDTSIASDHTFKDFRSLNHKLKAIEIGLELFQEIVLVDWDCHLIRPIDSEFYTSLKAGGPLQVPLYIYPEKAFVELKKVKDINPFITELEKQVKANSYKYEGGYVIPNTGFVYCNSLLIAKKLIQLSLDNNLLAVPDELSVMRYALDSGLTMEQYIETIEPQVVIGKQHELDWWIDDQNTFNEYIEKLKYKKIYFDHR